VGGTAAASLPRREPHYRRSVHVHLRDDPSVVLRVPLKCVAHQPPHDGNAAASTTTAPLQQPRPPAPLFLCAAFADGCPAAPGTCPDVHADVSTATRLRPHRRLDGDGGSGGGGGGGGPHMQRLDAAAGTLLVAAPNEQVATLRVAAGECLATRALEAARSPLSLCAHYLGPKAACDYGAACQFVHPAPGAAITADPAAVPAPHPLRSLIDLVAVDTAYPPTDAAARGIGSTPGTRTVAPPSSRRSEAWLCATSQPSLCASAADAVSPPRVPAASDYRTGRRFQHDPYRRRGWWAASSGAGAASRDSSRPMALLGSTATAPAASLRTAESGASP